MHRGSISYRRKLGSYYTPSNVADVLCTWAIRNPDDKILEPSFGGCEFITSAHKRLSSLGCIDPLKNIIGADIDSAADAGRPS